MEWGSYQGRTDLNHQDAQKSVSDLITQARSNEKKQGATTVEPNTKIWLAAMPLPGASTAKENTLQSLHPACPKFQRMKLASREPPSEQRKSPHAPLKPPFLKRSS